MHVGYGYWLVPCTVDSDTVRYYPDLCGQAGPLSGLNVSDPDPDPTFFAYKTICIIFANLYFNVVQLVIDYTLPYKSLKCFKSCA
jgi:hypothetical protein